MSQNDGHWALSFFKTNWLNILLVCLMIGLGSWMATLIATSDGKSPRDAAYQALILTIASVIASLIVTKIYAEQGHGQSLRDHGVQIAGGIIVLKRQIEVLADWVSAKRTQLIAGTQIPEVTDAVLEHIEQTLSGFRGMTDAALGGIAGVIGDALAQYESVMEQISRIRLDALQQTREIEQKIQTAGSSAEITTLRSQIQEIAIKTDRDIAQLARKSAIPIPEQPKRLADDVPLNKTFSYPCPTCSKENSFQIPDRAGETKVILCVHCGLGFNAHLVAGGKVLARPLGRVQPTSRETTAFQGSVLYRLRQTQALVSPAELDAIINAILSADAVIRSGTDGASSPRRLQEALFDYLETGQLQGTGRASVRIVFKLLYQGRAFRFPPAAPVSFSATIVNALDRRQLYQAYVRACIYRLRGAVVVHLESASELAGAILPEDLPDGKAMIEKALMDVPVLDRRQ